MESSRHDRLLGGIRQQVAGELFDRELFERQVAIEGIDHPIAVHPDLTLSVGVVAVRIGVAGDVEPVPAPALAIGGRIKQALHNAFVGAWRGVFDKVANHVWSGREPGEI